ncbi:hypothetical protein DFH09DRAFT_1439681 [Mycena vulgaris]|nr:hypothetical protein DFH09DRAFT_1439681 [Mycena vulgaris]
MARLSPRSGDADDEGAIFSLSTLNVTTDEDFSEYIYSVWAPTADAARVATLISAYPSEIRAGSSFGTGILNALSPQFKRLAAFQDDVMFHAPRRFWRCRGSRISGRTYTSAAKRSLSSAPCAPSLPRGIPRLMTLPFSIAVPLTDYLVNFVTDLDSKGATIPNWPKYTSEVRNLMTFLDGIGSVPMNVI